MPDITTINSFITIKIDEMCADCFNRDDGCYSSVLKKGKKKEMMESGDE